MSIYQHFLDNTGRPVHQSCHYFLAFERHFGRYVGSPVNFLEIGSGNGGSSQMFKRWLGPLARIVTIDINDECLSYADEQIHVRIGDQSDEQFLASIVSEFGAFDAVLDDGSHQMAHLTTSFEFLYPRIAAHGVYMIENVHTAYWPEFGGGRGDPRSIIERFKGYIDELNADHIRDRSVPISHFTRTTVAMTAYDSVLVFEKSPLVNKINKTTGIKR